MIFKGTQILSSIFILLGMLIMFFAIMKTRILFEFLEFLKSSDKKSISKFLVFHRILMVFFLFGYFVVLISYIFEFPIINEFFVSVIFFFGAIFVYLSMILQATFMSKIGDTINGLLPICCVCKKIRKEDSNPKEAENWESIEAFLCQKGEVKLTHGICPDCFNDQLNEVKKIEKKVNFQ